MISIVATPVSDKEKSSAMPDVIPNAVSILFLNPCVMLSLTMSRIFGPGTTMIMNDANR